MSQAGPEKPKKTGETVRITFDQVDGDGKLISRTESEWYGFTNQMANAFSISAVRIITNLVEQFGKDKAA